MTPAVRRRDHLVAAIVDDRLPAVLLRAAAVVLLGDRLPAVILSDRLPAVLLRAVAVVLLSDRLPAVILSGAKDLGRL
jgi:uncharacterized MnhB-related membrane protein